MEKFCVSLLVFLVLWWEVWRRGWLVLQQRRQKDISVWVRIKCKTQSPQKTQDANINSDQLCCATERRSARHTLGLNPRATGTHRGHVDIVGVPWAVVSTGSSFSSLGFSCHRERSDRLGTHRELLQ